jgi:hypothetical protein
MFGFHHATFSLLFSIRIRCTVWVFSRLARLIIVWNFVRFPSAPRSNTLIVLFVGVVDVPSDARPVLMTSIPTCPLRALYVVNPFNGRRAAIHPPAIHIHADMAVDRAADLIAARNCCVRERRFVYWQPRKRQQTHQAKDFATINHGAAPVNFLYPAINASWSAADRHFIPSSHCQAR